MSKDGMSRDSCYARNTESGCKSGILLQQPIALLEGVSVHFKCVLYYPEVNERT